MLKQTFVTRNIIAVHGCELGAGIEDSNRSLTIDLHIYTWNSHIQPLQWLRIPSLCARYFSEFQLAEVQPPDAFIENFDAKDVEPVLTSLHFLIGKRNGPKIERRSSHNVAWGIFSSQASSIDRSDSLQRQSLGIRLDHGNKGASVESEGSFYTIDRSLNVDLRDSQLPAPDLHAFGVGGQCRCKRYGSDQYLNTEKIYFVHAGALTQAECVSNGAKATFV